MRLCLFCLLLSAYLGAQPTPDSTANAVPRTARVEGQVLARAGEPRLRKTTVRLTLNENRGSNPVYYTDTTDAIGKFVFEDVIPRPVQAFCGTPTVYKTTAREVPPIALQDWCLHSPRARA